MKKRYTFSSGDSFEADLDDLKRLLAENQQYVENYEDVLSSLYDDEYVARGNGFCDRKYSDDFVESQLEKYQQRVEELKNWIKSHSWSRRETIVNCTWMNLKIRKRHLYTKKVNCEPWFELSQR